MKRSCLFTIAALLLLTAATRAGELQPALRDFAARLPEVRTAIPAITEAATAAAKQMLAHPQALLHVPYAGQLTFAEEMFNRAGGLAHAMPPRHRKTPATDRDVVLMSVRQWDALQPATLKQLRDWADGPQTLILIADAAGKPADLDPQFLIDTPGSEGRINVLTNVAVGWMWCCEYVAAMTRDGNVPGILVSVAWEHGKVHNKPLQTPEGRHWIGPCDTPVAAGVLAEAYLQRVEQLVADLASPARQMQVNQAAAVIADYLARGKKVGVSGVGHVIVDEVNHDLQSPMVGFRAVWRAKRAFKQNLSDGDLLVWIAYMGMDSAYMKYSEGIAEAGADLITSYSPWPPDDYGGPPMIDHPPPPNTLAHIDQTWAIGDAEVTIPCAPGRIAPISGLNSGLILRMLDDAVAARVEKQKATTKTRSEEEGHKAE